MTNGAGRRGLKREGLGRRQLLEELDFVGRHLGDRAGREAVTAIDLAPGDRATGRRPDACHDPDRVQRGGTHVLRPAFDDQRQAAVTATTILRVDVAQRDHLCGYDRRHEARSNHG